MNRKLSQEGQSLKDYATDYVEERIRELGADASLPPQHHDTVIGYFLFQKAQLQMDQSAQARKGRKRKRADELERSALIHARLSLQFAPSIVQEMTGKMRDVDESFPLHRARFLGRRLTREQAENREKKERRGQKAA